MSAATAPRLTLGRVVERHWLALLNGLLGLFAAVPVLAPLLMAAGWDAPARSLYRAYHLICHQWPGRSYFLFGPHAVYDPEALGVLARAGGYLGGPDIGWKLAWCERDFAMYTAAFLAGLVYACCRRQARPLPWGLFALCLLPIAIDGVSQLAGWHESTWLLRTLTGALAGWAGVWFAFPRIERALRESAPPPVAGTDGAARWSAARQPG